jgi:uncharacterized delta-60 repeat protein
MTSTAMRNLLLAEFFQADLWMSALIPDGWAVKNLVTPGYDVVRSVAIQPDGKILLAGESNGEIAVSRLNIDGTDDVSFASSGTFKDALDANDDVLYSVILQSDGNILAAGGGSINDNVDFLLIRLTTDGQFDPTFDVDGVVYTDFLGSNDFVHSMLLQPDGRIVAAGSAFNYYWTDVAVSRYESVSAREQILSLIQPSRSFLIHQMEILR